MARQESNLQAVMSEGRKEEMQEEGKEGGRWCGSISTYICTYGEKITFLIKISIDTNTVEAAMSTSEYSARHVANTGVFYNIRQEN